MRFMVAPQTVFYYRQREGSLLKEANSISTRQIPDTSLHHPRVLMRCVSLEREQRPLGQKFLPAKARNRDTNVKQAFFADPVCRELTYATIRVDPGMNFGIDGKRGQLQYIVSG